ncbi:MAG: response regulator transcription factor [Opitutales bacterium]
MKKHILIVEDDSHIRLGLCEALTQENYEVSETGMGNEVLTLVRARKPDLVLLDIMLPGKNGYEICKELREQGFRIPVIMTTAKGQEIDRVLGLEIGADDYVTKPFSVRELVARVKAQLRRTDYINQADAPQEHALPEKIEIGAFSITVASQRGQWIDDASKKPVELTIRELNLLLLLCRKRGDVVSREHIFDKVWGMDYLGTTRTLDQLVVKLRQKIEKNPSKPQYLVTVHGVGYRLEQ